MIVIGLDPGYEQSGYVIWDTQLNAVVRHDITANEPFIGLLRARKMQMPDTPFGTSVVLVIEQIASMGMAVGKTTFETVYWSGRFAEAFHPNRVERVTRRDVKLHLCGQARATDSNIRQALIDRFGPSTQQAFGTKKAQGPLYGITSHKLSALAVALTWADLNQQPAGEIIRPGVIAQF